jgi:D-aspartate ligase
MASAKPLACVMGDMDLVRPLGMAGVACAVVAKPGDPTRYSRFTRGTIEWADAWTESEALLERLLAFGRSQADRPVLFYEEDRELLLISRNRERLSEVFRFVVGERDLVEDLVDKARFQKLAERLRLPVPATRRIDPAATSAGDVDLPFPLMLKPMTRRTERWSLVGGDRKGLQVESAAELRELWPRMVESGLEFLAQELVPGPESAIESYHVYVDAAGATRAEFTGKKIRTFPLEFGLSTALRITEAPDVAELGRELVRRLNLTGVAKFDFKRAPNGRLYLFEVNPRFNLWHHPGAVAGVNIPAQVYGDLTGFPVPEVRPARPGVCWTYAWHDVLAARKLGMSLPQWTLWTLRCEAKSAIAWDDPMPFVRGVLWRHASRGLGLARRPAPHAAARLQAAPEA